MNLNWTMISLVTSVTIAWTGILVGMIRWILSAYHVAMLDRLARVEGAIQRLSDNFYSESQRLNGEIHRVREELPAEYVRREDHIRSASFYTEKIDALAEKIDRLFETSD